MLIPFIVPTVLSAIAFWWIFDAQFSIISWSLKHIGLISQNINFLGDANWARFSVLFTFTDFQLIWAMTRGGPVNATHLMATLSYQRAILAGNLGEGAAISTAMIPFLLAAIMISWFGLQRRKWQHGEAND